MPGNGESINGWVASEYFLSHTDSQRAGTYNLITLSLGDDAK